MTLRTGNKLEDATQAYEIELGGEKREGGFMKRALLCIWLSGFFAGMVFVSIVWAGSWDEPMKTMRGTPIEDGPPCFQTRLLDLTMASPDDDVVERAMLLRKAFGYVLGAKYWKPGYGYVSCGPYAQYYLGFEEFDINRTNLCTDGSTSSCELARGHGIDYKVCRDEKEAP